MKQKVYGYAPENKMDDSVYGYDPKNDEKETIVFRRCTDILRNTDRLTHQEKPCTGMLRKKYGHAPEYDWFDDDF